MVEKVTVFRPDKGIMPYLLFWVIDAPAGTAEGGAGSNSGEEPGWKGSDAEARNKTYVVEERVVRRGRSEGNVVREHVFRAKL